MFLKILNYFLENKKKLYLTNFMLVLGAVFGSIYFVLFHPAFSETTQEFANSFFLNFSENKLVLGDIFLSSLFNNFKFVILVAFFGLLPIGTWIICFILMLKGFGFGFTIAFFVKCFFMKGFSFCLIGILPSFLISLIFVSFLAIGAMNESARKPSYIKNKKQIFYFFSSYGVFVLICLFGFLISSFIEAFFSAPIVKLVFGG